MPKTNTNAKTSFDPASAFPAFAMPDVDVDAMAAFQRRNVEALTEANKLATDGVQAFATRQAEILKNVVDAYSDAMRGLMAVNDPQTSFAKQAEMAKATFETSNSNLRELATLATKAQSKSLDVINKRVVEGIDEFQTLAAKG